MKARLPARGSRAPLRRSFAVIPSAALGCAVALFALPAGAEGFRNPPAGAFGLGRAGGRTAQIDDVTAVTHNPANLMDLERPQVSVEPGFVYIATDFTSPGGSAQTRDPFKILPAVFAAWPVLEDRLTLGLGITSPYGLSNEWEQSGAFADTSSPLTMRYQGAYYSELKTINLQPTVAVRLCERATLGVGLDVMWSELQLRQFYPWSAGFGPGLPDGTGTVKGDGTGLGVNAGLTLQLTPRQRLAATVRSPIDINYRGDFDISNFPAVAALAGASPHSDFDSGIQFPLIIGVGYGINLTDTVRLEIQGEWLQFSNFDNLQLNLRNNAVLFPTTNIRQAWKDTFTIGFAGDWEFKPGWVVRGGYQFYESPVPADTISPSIPDADQNVITIGLGYRHGRHSLEAAFSEVFYATRNISNNQTAAFNGRYETTVHLFNVAYRLAF